MSIMTESRVRPGKTGYGSRMLKLFFLIFYPSIICCFLLIPIWGVYAQDYELVWSDEFDGTSLDENKWEIMIGDGTDYSLPSGWGNNELQWYTGENLSVKDGVLTVTAKKESRSGKDYTSSRIRTLKKGDWKYGRFEIRARLPEGQGIWAALWMMPTDDVYGGWAASGEIDIMEIIGHEPGTVHGTLHFGGKWPNNAHKGKSFELESGKFSEDFHTFALDWRDGMIRWFVDDNHYQTQTSGNWHCESAGAANPNAPFDQYFHLLINLAVGGNWPGSPDASTVFPQNLEVDYVRVYQEKTSNVQKSSSNSPEGFTMLQNFPNPFNGSTQLRYFLQEDGDVRLSVYNPSGQLIESFVQEKQHAGEHTFRINLDSENSGVYIAQLTAGQHQSVKKLLLLN